MKKAKVTERVSVRLAAQSLQPQMAPQHPMHARAAPIYLPHHLNTLAFAAVPIMMPHPPPTKRSLEPEDNEAPASKAKKARGKAKAPESNGNGEYICIIRSDNTSSDGPQVRAREVMPPRSVTTLRLQTVTTAPLHAKWLSNLDGHFYR